ncbi:NitT/TauT family transport system permease protein [Alkalispirochaeta americana]|uniref:NitT/TauT family transport system permease protein n=1 Tax=Alkalispirochaeta americana TaxID=159291 RepID=A0A1N6WBT7_9SPIO|nr:ATP-binding cassette domain-containing protein [Alkalispirochaeta americana]SIQ87643.1 NitT/TauT family transport system permease protein [Alkalispirochaeta americana]
MIRSRAGYAGAGALIALWWAGSALVAREILLPSPPVVFHALRKILADPSFGPTLAASLARWVLGWFLSLVGAVVLASLAVGRPNLARFLRPALVTVRSVPVVSVILLALIWLPLDGVPVFVSLLVSLPLLYQGVLDGLRSVDRDLLDMGRLFRVSLPGRIWHIHIPGAAPVVLSAATSAAGMSWKAVIAAEVLSQPRLAVGTSMHVAKLYLETPSVIAWTFIAVLMATLVDGALGVLDRHLLAWCEVPEHRQGHEPDKRLARRVGLDQPGGEPLPASPVQTGRSPGSGLEEEFPLLFPSSGPRGGRPSAGIVLRSVSFSFPGVPLFENFNLEIEPGSATAILGRSGAGKTTLLRLLAGDLLASGGSITRSCRSNHRGDIKDASGSSSRGRWIRRFIFPRVGQEEFPRVGFVFQEPRLLPWRSVLDNLLLVLPRRGTRSEGRELRRQLAAFLETLRLPRPGDYPGALSGGMKQRVNLIRAFLRSASVICLDEPLANQDAATRGELRSLIRELRTTIGPALVMVTHSRQEALALADRVIILADQHPTKIIGDFLIKDISSDEREKVVQQIDSLLEDT